MLDLNNCTYHIGWNRTNGKTIRCESNSGIFGSKSRDTDELGVENEGSKASILF